MTACERAGAVLKLPQHVRSLLPRIPLASVPSVTEWLIQNNFQPISGNALQRAYDRMPPDDPTAKRRLFLQAMAGGLAPGSSVAREFWAPGRNGILQHGPNIIRNSILFQDPGKLHRWVQEGGQRSHVGNLDLQPTGRVGALRKRFGNVKACGNFKAAKGTSKCKQKIIRSGKKAR